MTLMPGLITSHFHAQFGFLGEGGEHGFYSGSERPVGVLMAAAMKAARLAIESGYTSFVGAGCSDDLDFQLKMAIAENLTDGPRILAASRVINSTGYEGESVPWWRDLRNAGLYLFADGPEELRKAVRTEIRRGAEIIKIQPTGGHGFPSRSGQASIGVSDGSSEAAREVKLSGDEVSAVVRAAHERGRRVRAHVAFRDSILECIELGVDLIDHGDEIDEECIDAMVACGTFWVPSLLYLRKLLDTSRQTSATEAQVASVERDFAHLCKMIPKANEAGVKILLGDDYGIPSLFPFEAGCFAEELELYTKAASIDPLDVLRWGTVHGAELMELDAELGRVEQGFLADLIVVDGDPSNDIGCFRDPDALKIVMRDGLLVRNVLDGSPV
jgi:imidazolonepropionase-like amidohydrolase